MKTELFWIPGPWPGRLAISSRPRGGDWLEDELQTWRDCGVEVIVSTLEPREVIELDLSKEANLCQSMGLTFMIFPISDRGVPSSLSETTGLVFDLEARLRQGASVMIHCRQGIGRSSLLAACLLVVGGIPEEEAFSRIQKARGRPVPDTEEQRKWVVRFARETLAAREVVNETP